jgi:Not1 N-terminal domain, CCR4-Not complex component
VCEKETKTKAFSKEGLARASTMDPEEAARAESRYILYYYHVYNIPYIPITYIPYIPYHRLHIYIFTYIKLA